MSRIFDTKKPLPPTPAANLKLKPGKRPRILRGHPWVFTNELETVPSPESRGQVLPLLDSRGKSLGYGIVNPDSQICWRRIGREPITLDAAFFEERIGRAVAQRCDDLTCRLVWSEADGLPGLVIDRFREILVVQALTVAMDRHLETIIAVLKVLLQPREILLRNDAPSRKLEGLPLRVATASGQPLEPGWVDVDGIDYWLDLAEAQKTGFYLDQRAQHRRIAGLAKGCRVLDAFCNQGAFALQASKAGAASVEAVDSSAPAIEAGLHNAEHNGLEVTFRQENVFDMLSDLKSERDAYDLIVLDPPSFARNKGAVTGAIRGYKELNLRAMRLLSLGGILATYACSQHVTREVFFDLLREAAHDSGREVTLIEATGQPADHPVLLTFPESEYLKGAILRVD